MARAIVEESTGDETPGGADAVKDPAAVARGKVGGRKSDNARPEALTPEERSEIASTGAAARWGKEYLDPAGAHAAACIEPFRAATCYSGHVERCLDRRKGPGALPTRLVDSGPLFFFAGPT
jgi:hypothetical protein